jgi:DNA-binding FrmR family transcriptional regulator
MAMRPEQITPAAPARQVSREIFLMPSSRLVAAPRTSLLGITQSSLLPLLSTARPPLSATGQRDRGGAIGVAQSERQSIFWSMRGYTQDKDAYLKRLRRIEGQVRGLQRMVEDDTYCIDVLTQISAVTRALQAVAVGLLEDHLGHCVTQAIEDGGPDAQDKVKEAAQAVARLVRS